MSVIPLLAAMAGGVLRAKGMLQKSLAIRLTRLSLLRNNNARVTPIARMISPSERHKFGEPSSDSARKFGIAADAILYRGH